MTRLSRAADGFLRAGALVLFVSMAAAAWHDVSKAWDVWYYHLPFAARLAGIVDGHAYAFSAENAARYAGFPLVAEALQGLLWRMTGRPEAANLVSFAVLPALTWWLRREHAVPLHLSFLAFIAIPLVQIHATAAYVDLFANGLATVLVLAAYRAVVTGAPPTPRRLGALAVVAAAAANTKFQLVPVVLAASLVLVVVAARKHGGDGDHAVAGRRRRVAIVALAVPLVLATPIKNVVTHGNPVWPVELRILGRSLPHADTAYEFSPAWLEDAPRPVRFAASALELRARPITSGRRWSIDQWAPSDDPAVRTGGFFGAYVVVNLAALALAVVRRRSREAWVAAAFVGVLGVVIGVLPQSHELRYYLVWMLTLVAVNLALWARERPLLTGLVAASATAVVAVSTGGTYLWPSGDRFATLVVAKTDLAAVREAPPGTRVCVAREPWTFLYAPTFHPGATWTVQEAAREEDCGQPLR